MKKSLIKNHNKPQNILDIDYLGGSLLSDCLPMVYEDRFSMKKMNECFHNFTINKGLWREEFSTCEISENCLYYI